MIIKLRYNRLFNDISQYCVCLVDDVVIMIVFIVIVVVVVFIVINIDDGDDDDLILIIKNILIINQDPKSCTHYCLTFSSTS